MGVAVVAVVADAVSVVRGSIRHLVDRKGGKKMNHNTVGPHIAVDNRTYY